MLNIPEPVQLTYFSRHQPSRVFPQPNSEIIENNRKFHEEDKSIHFERELTFVSAVNFILNSVIGTGIFVGPGVILQECGSIGMTLAIWCLCGAISLITALPFTELCSVVPQSGSQYIYVHEAFHDLHPFWGHTPGFMFIWINFIIMRPATIAIHTLLATEYMYPIVALVVSDEFDNCYRVWIKSIIGPVLIIFIGIINCQSLKIFIFSQDLIAYFKMMVCLTFITSGVYMFISEQGINFEINFHNTSLKWTNLPVVMFSGLYAFDGASTVTGACEEIQDPERTVLRSIIMGLGVVSATYFLLILTFLSALTVPEIIESSTVAKLYAEEVFGVSASFFFSLCISISTIGTNLSGIFYGSRLGYAAAKEGHMLEFLCYIHRTRLTPLPAVIFQVGLALILYSFVKSTEILINSSSYILWLYYGITMIALFILRVKRPDANRPYKVPLVLPISVLIISWVLVICAVISQPASMYIFTVLILVSGIVVQYLFVYKKKRIRGLRRLTKVLQRWLDVVPPS